MESPAQTTLTTRSAGVAPHDVVVVRLPASSAYLSILRTATAGLAALVQFTLDEIEDLRIAVDEACAVLLAHHPAAATTRVGELLTGNDLTCRYTLHDRAIDVEVSLRFRQKKNTAELPRNTFAWQVMNALADDIEAFSRSDELVLRLTKRKATP